MIRLNDIRVRIDEGKGPFSRGKSCLDLRPKRGEVEHGEKELVEAHDEQIPRADADQSLLGAHAADIDQNADENASDRVERGEDQREHKSAPNVDSIRLLV